MGTRPRDPTARLSTADQVRSYLAARPVVQQALRQGIVNLSALARQVMQETGLGREEAVVTALRRERHRPVAQQEQAVRQALQGIRMEVRSPVGMLTYHADWALLEQVAKTIGQLPDEGRVHVFHGWEDITVVADEATLDAVAQRVQHVAPVAHRNGLVELNLRSHEAEVAGFLAATTGAMAARGINIIDAVSCRADHIFLIEEEDLPHAITALDRLKRP